MSIDDALVTVREVEAKEHRSNGHLRGQLVHEAFETIIRAVESITRPPTMQFK
jgi:hypothetical protein